MLQRLLDFFIYFFEDDRPVFMQHFYLLSYFGWTVDASVSYFRRIMFALQGVIGCLWPTKLLFEACTGRLTWHAKTNAFHTIYHAYSSGEEPIKSI